MSHKLDEAWRDTPAGHRALISLALNLTAFLVTVVLLAIAGGT